MKIRMFFLILALGFSLSSCQRNDADVLPASPVSAYLPDSPEQDEPYRSHLTLDQIDALALDCAASGIPFSRELLLENMPVEGRSLKKTQPERYRAFMEAFGQSRTTEEQGAIESYTTRTGKTAVRDASADLVAMTYSTFGECYGQNVSWDFNRTGSSNGCILNLDLWLCNAAYSSSFGDDLVEFEPDCIQWGFEVSGGNWLIGLECPIFINGVPFGPYEIGQLIYQPTANNETFNECGQITSFVDGNVVGPIGGGITSISVFGVVPPEYPFGCE